MTGRAVGLFSKAEPGVTGTWRYAATLATTLPTLGLRVDWRTSRCPLPAALRGVVRRAGVDVAAVWQSYPPVTPRLSGSVLHLTSQTLATAVALTRPDRPLVVTVHDLLPYALRDEPTLTTLRHPVDRGLYRLAIRGLARADLLLADSAYTAGEATRLAGVPPERVRVVPLGVDRTRFRPDTLAPRHRQVYGLREDERYVLYVGSEDPRKNLPTLFAAFARVASERPDLRLLKVGQAHHVEQRARLERIAAEAGVGDRVRFLDTVPDEDLPPLYEAAAVCAVPSLYEGFGLPVLEAMACGAPVVCANRTSLPEVAGDAASVVEPTVEGLARAIGDVVDDDARRQRMRAAGLDQATRFTWAATGSSTAAAYEEAASHWWARRGHPDARGVRPVRSSDR